MSVKTWGDFEIYLDRLLGRGGMGAVYMGRQVSLDRPAAIKILKKDLTQNPDFVKRFHREAALLARIVDNHVVQVFGAGEGEGEHFYAMEFVEGEDFASRIKGGHKFTADEVLRVGLSVGIALQAAWRHRIIHRDIKPSNILLTKDHNVKVMDFGLAKNPESDLTVSEVIMGTAKYMSPEQATGAHCDIRSDLYSLGVVLYELATGVPPFIGESPTAIMYQHVHKQARPPREINAEIPEEIEKLILRLMAKEPEARFATPDAVISHIRCIQDGVTPDEKSTLYNETILANPGAYAPTRKSTVHPPPVPTAPRRSNSAALGLSLVAVVLMLGAGGYYVWDILHRDPPQPIAQPPELPPAVVIPKPPVDSDPIPGTPQPPPTPVPQPPPPPGAAAWEEPRKKGIEAFGARQWVMAYTLLEESEKLGAKDVAEKARQAHANEHIEKAEAETDEEASIQHYEAARKFVDDEPIRLRIRNTSFRRWRKSAEKSEGGDWTKAADDWKRAVEYAEEGQVEEVRERQQFCAQFSEAVIARATQDWKRAAEIFRKLSKNPRGYSVTLELELKRAEFEVARSAEMAAKELRREFDDLVEQGKRVHHRAAWAEAKAIFDRTNDPKYAAFAKAEPARYLAELAVALSAPPGMGYVPAGKFRMGGGRAVEDPEGDAETGAFYIDDRETRVSEYGEYLKAVGQAHHPGCHRDEPPGKKHIPYDWEGQRPEDPVVGVDWWDAASFAAWRKKRLPRESEWERAASFDPFVRRVYAWGPKYQKEGGKSYLGFDGMGTGVIEWTDDWFQRYRWSPADHADFGEKRKVLRGGVLLAEDAVESTKVTYRHWYAPTYRSKKIGFRCVQDVPEK